MALTLRPARPDDAAEIARLFLISSDGLAAYIWSRLQQPGESLETVGARRYAREGVAFSYQNCTMAEVDGQLAGMLHAFSMEPEEAGPAEEPDPILRPYAELEDYGSLYVSGVAVHPGHRGRGIGTLLMAAADERARTRGLPRVSLICFERNEGAMRLYRRLGYRELDRRPLVPHPTLTYERGDAVLLVHDVAPPG